ncbi:MAG: hypothetical protein H6818_10360 [Phycisphaerales bacterium]|nr:hypothetical protein [Phycisphaerales bacterium]MCB9863896.1 hypothetical protein [Phycisphaerales bacterium]
MIRAASFNRRWIQPGSFIVIDLARLFAGVVSRFPVGNDIDDMGPAAFADWREKMKFFFSRRATLSKRVPIDR